MTQESPSTGLHRDSIPPDRTSGARQTLKQAIRQARFDDAERAGVQSDLRASQIGRLELLHEALGPLLAQIPDDATDLFDVGLMPGATPRLFVDMIGFVEMGRDSRLYRLIQDTRYARLIVAEAADVPVMVEAVTQYVARRLLEREKALAAAAQDLDSASLAVATPSGSPGPKPRLLRWAGRAFAFIIDLFGAIAFFSLLAAAGWLLWYRVRGQL